MRVAEEFGLSDVGRQRDANEDSWVIAPPFYVVADGMGGARAGEVASQLAAESFAAARAEGGTPEQILESLAQEANQRIYELAQRDDSRRGMGTTLTAAMVGDGSVTVGHVGDSRAYRLRSGMLEQLTYDHSLVAELERSGQLTREAAETHPQRSIITRALGPESRVEVDTHTHRARGGDVYLLCSDGLTSMISDDDVAGVLRGAGSLEEAGESLVRAANQSGGKDNITVVLFRLEDSGGGEAAPAAAEPADDDTLSGAETIHQGLTADDVHAAVAEQERARATSPQDKTGAVHPASGPSRPPAGVRRKQRSPLGRLVAAVVALAVVAALAFGAYAGVRSVWFIGTNDQGLMTLYRGIPYDLPLGIELYSEQRVSGVPARSVPAARRERLLDHEWRGREDAEDLMRAIERGEIDPGRPRS